MSNEPNSDKPGGVWNCFGCPSEIRTDNRTELVSSVSKEELLQSLVVQPGAAAAVPSSG
ncbi:hypothetical protein ACVWYH_009027 [Bradyrhizobium sp. GM24.11]